MIIAGIDPGQKGGIAILDVCKNAVVPISFIEIPYDEFKEIMPEEIYEILKIADVIVLEQVHSFPGQGISSTARFMKEYGIIKGISHSIMHSKTNEAIVHGKETSFKVIDVSPQKWKKDILGKGKHDKQDSIDEALKYVDKNDLLRTPRCRKPSDGFAEAFLIALWYYHEQHQDHES